MTATTTGLAGQQQARPPVRSARQSMTRAPAAGRWRPAGPLQAVDCCARSGLLMTMSLAHAPGHASGPLLPGQQAQRPKQRAQSPCGEGGGASCFNRL